ncbi:hypothetical protein EXIGLDRAFT_762922 [Exidia glandulosa HHB12029]|uniref:DUF6534 domain-containing protein n=1 Tax=Exidia glandulosa HHB12029 TaxID=1314781 RepID=A0A165MEH8_EXIGL|nr:hypothetical protein EXIGLDRAFT_762922 [Exidia glandulosa HHB12029]
MSAIYDWTLGTLLVGVYVNTFLYGIVSFQFAAYFNSSLDDRAWLRAVVSSLCIIDTAQVASVMYMMYVYLIKHFGDDAIIAVPLWPYPFTALTNAISAFLVQVVLSYKIYRLTRDNKYIFSGLLAYSVAVLVIGTTASIRAWTIDRNVGYSQLVVLNDIVAAWHGLEVGLDVIITASLTVILTRARTGFRKTDTIINRFIRGAVQTGLFGALVSIAIVVTFIRWPKTNVYGLFAMFHGRIYSNTLMETLLALVQDPFPGIAMLITRCDFGQSMWGIRSTGNSMPYGDRLDLKGLRNNFQAGRAGRGDRDRDLYKHSVTDQRNGGGELDLESAYWASRLDVVKISAFEDETVPTPRQSASNTTLPPADLENRCSFLEA